MLVRVIQALIAAILVTTVGTASYFGGLEAGRRSVSLGASPVASAPAAESPASLDENAEFKVFWEAWHLVDKEFYNQQSIDHKKMVYGAIKGMLESLDDPYTSFATPSHAQITEEDMRGSFDGIGVVVEMKDKKLTVVAPQEDTPGEKAGIKPGDVIVAVDGKKTADLTLLEAVAMIRGPRGTKVRLTIVREGQPNPLEIEVTRAEIKTVNVKAKDMGDSIAYVKLNGLAAPSARELSQAVKGVVDKKGKGIVLDLRNNPGGLLQSAVDIASIFMRDGVVLYEDQRDGKSIPFNVKKGAIAPDIPLVVLINKGSASASEIVAGALQDSERAKLIGEQSFGKDTVQNVHELSDKSSVRITIAHWATPKRQDIHQKGLKPDIEVKYTEDDFKAGRDPQLDKAVEYLKGVNQGAN